MLVPKGKRFMSQRQRNAVKRGLAILRRAVPVARMDPTFLIIGAQKAYTTSLLKYLQQHPSFLSPLLKDIYFFDINFHRGLRWYRGFFPSMRRASRTAHLTSGPAGSGESATYYFLHPLAPQRIRATYPNIPLVVLLRDPVRRAISHYYHNVGAGRESILSAADAFRHEEERLGMSEEQLVRFPQWHSPEFQHFSYLKRGRYLEQLQRWWAVFPRDQLLVVFSEELAGAPNRVFREICRFVGLKEHTLPSYDVFGAGNQRRRDYGEAVEFAREYFREPNQALFDVLGRRCQEWL